MKRISLYLITVVLLFSCQKGKKNQIEDSLTTTPVSKGVNVTTSNIHDKPFQTQLIANGKVEAIQKSELRFKINEQLATIQVKNGQEVVKDQVLASLENQLLVNELEKTKLNLEKALNKLEEEKINYGLSNTADKNINSKILKSLQMKSGYFEAKNALENAQLRYNQTILKAPFSGIIANIETKVGDYYSASEVFCTLINPNNLEVVFSIIENELSFVSKGQQVTIESFANSDRKYKGVITEVNPLVDKNGLIQIKASIQSKKNKQLFDGMHVKILVNKPIDNVLVIPKEALVLRSNRKVVFAIEKGLAKWNYVTQLFENSTLYAIKKGENLKATDTIIIYGNMNLSHDAKVNATFVSRK